MLNLILAILLVFGISADTASAQGGVEFQVNSSSGEMKEPRVSTATDGSFVVVWKNKVSEINEQILARMYDATGNAVGNDFTVNTSSGEHKKPSISMAADGSFVVAWEKKISDNNGSIYSRRYNASGSALGGEFLINTSTGELKEPDIALNSGGSFVVTWKKKIADDDEDIWGRRYDASGNPLSGEFMVNSSGGKHKKPRPMVAVDGSFIIAWEKKTSDTVKDILARRYDASGSPIGSEFQLSTSAGEHSKPTVGMAGDGSFVAAWKKKIDGSSEDVIARRFDASGNPLGGEYQINTSGATLSSPSLGVASNGSYTIVSEDKTGKDIAGRDYDASDNPISSEYTINTTVPGDQKKPDIGMNTGGVFVTVWEDKDTKYIFGRRGAGSSLFTNVSGTVGFDVQATDDVNSGSGLHWADYDNDGDLDAIITGNNSARLLVSASEGASFFATTFGGGNYPRQGAMLDIDNDGDIDFWHSGESFHENNGSASFTVAGDLGFSNPSGTESTAAADVNGDGYCDVLMFSANGNWIGTHQGGVVEKLLGTNNSSDGLNEGGDYGAGGYCSSGDVNSDGFLDFFYHYGNGKLFLSNGDGTFTQNASGISVATSGSQEVGSAWGDYDNDGDLDLFVPRFASGSYGYLWRNDGGTFVDVTVSAGLTDMSGHRGCCWGDYDNDGDLDLYICVSSGANVLYQNQGDGTFTSVTEGTNITNTSQDAVFVDYDNDGDLDLAITQEGEANVLLQNGTDDTNYLKVRLIGHGLAMTNKAAIGVRVDLYQSNGTTFIARREIGVARGLGGTEPLWVHFGGLTKTTSYVVKAHFASGVVDVSVVPQDVTTTIGTVTINQMLTITERKPDVSVWAEVDPR